MPKKLIGLILVLVAVGLFVNTLTRSPYKGNSLDQKMISQTTPAVRLVAIKETPEPVNQAVPAEDWLIEPGHRIGSITARTTLKDLETLFGKANVKVGKVPGPEGSEWDGVYLFPNQPEKKLKLIWKEKGQPQTVSTAIIESPKSVWHTVETITTGTTLKALESLNKSPFTMSGFDWDYGGTVLSWGDTGRLRAKFQQNAGLVLRLTPGENADEGLRSKVSGDQVFSSSNPALQKLNPTVSEMQVMLQ